MHPLLSREHLTFPAVILTILWAYLGAFTPNFKPRSISKALVILATHTLLILMTLAAHTFPPPARYPDLHTVLNVLVSAAAFVGAWLWTATRVVFSK
jgi:alpha-1,3-glucosyltransferase